MLKSVSLIYGYKTNNKIWIWASIFLTILTPYSLVLSYPILLWKSKYYSIENIYAQLIAFSIPFINNESILYFESGPKAFVILNALILFSAGFEKLESELWRSGNAVKGFVSLPYLVKPFAYPKIKKLSKIGKLILPLEILFIFSLTTVYSSQIFFIGMIMFGLTLFTIFDISYIGQLIVISMIGCLIIWPNYYITNFNLSSENLIIFSILSIILINLLYPSELLGKFLKIFTGIYTPVKVFTETHLTGIFSYKFKNKEKEILMAFDSNGMFHKSQLFTSRYKQSAMYKVTDYCLGKNNEDDIIDLAFQAAKGETVILCVKPYDSQKGYEFYKNNKWHEILEIRFNKEPKIIHLETPPKIKSFRRV